MKNYLGVVATVAGIVWILDYTRKKEVESELRGLQVELLIALLKISNKEIETLKAGKKVEA